MVSDSRKEAVARDYDAVKEDLRKLKTDVGAFAQDAYDAGCCSAADAAQSLKRGLRSTAVRSRIGLRMARGQVEAHPRTAVAAAFSLGLALGLVLMGRRA
jgi:ElaB/YqjD/DUF883 family membrane-anchored ribosome-binding protein